MANTLQVQFEKIVDWFAMQLGDEEKKRLVTIFHLPKKYYEAYPIIVFQGLKMTGVFGFENLEGLLDIANLLDRKDLFESTKPKLQELKRQKGLRKASTLIDLNMLYSVVDIGPAFEIAMKQIEVAEASSELLHKICKCRFKQEPEKKTVLCDRLKAVTKRLGEAVDLLTLMGEESIGYIHPDHNEISARFDSAKESPVTILAGDTIDEQPHCDGPSTLQRLQVPSENKHIYEDIQCNPPQIQLAQKREKKQIIPKLLVDNDCSSANNGGRNVSPPKTLPKPTLKSINANNMTCVVKPYSPQGQQLDVKLDKEGYALPSKINNLPVKTQLKENTGSGDSGLGTDSGIEWISKADRGKGVVESACKEAPLQAAGVVPGSSRSSPSPIPKIIMPKQYFTKK